jgi:hypothetical protein
VTLCVSVILGLTSTEDANTVLQKLFELKPEGRRGGGQKNDEEKCTVGTYMLCTHHQLRWY